MHSSKPALFKPRLYWSEGYWRVYPAPVRWQSLRQADRILRQKAHDCVNELNGREEWVQRRHALWERRRRGLSAPAPR